ncbi:hypothetical protein Patl1_10836 [Pistacia atlantica]|uniref:Uncharacterized protein n=1 Tax=Pistacia atlantica TaxID=434234 RepID=A0ACC1A3N1_9ROSI|nr:hypothetical protein Patl1_10836 [Pistacia atlantica]
MGSLPSPSRPTTPPPSPEQNYSGHQVYASFCLKESGPRSNISNWIECYTPSNNTWTHISYIPYITENHILKGFSMVSLGDSIYVIGGRLCHKERASGKCDEFVDVDDEVLSLVLRYNVQSNEWSKCATLVVPRYDFACVVCDNKIYVAGGKSNLVIARGISSAEVYDPTLDEWTSLRNMKTLRYKCVGVTWQGKIYVVGGFADRADSDGLVWFTERSSAEVFDTQAGKWDFVAGMWQLDVPPNQIVEVDNRLFSSGDCLKVWKGHIEAYDGNLNMWNEVDGSTHREDWGPIQRHYLTIAPIGTHLYFLAGYRIAGEYSQTVSMVHMFDTTATSDAWRSFEPMVEDGEKELCSHCCVVQVL